VNVRDTVRLAPNKFGTTIEESLLRVAQEEYEGIVDEDLGVVVGVTGLENVGEGKVVPGDGAAYYEADINLLVFKPEIGEVVEGSVSEITEFGAFIRIGPMEGLVHVSQIMDDYINYDAKATCFVGKETKKKIQMDDVIMAKIVSISMKGSIQNSKIGLTMRQPGLGKTEWIKLDRKSEKKGAIRKDKAKTGDEREGREKKTGKREKRQ